MPDHDSVDPNDVLAAIGFAAATQVRAMPGAEATVWRVVVGGRPLALRLHGIHSRTADRELVALEIAARNDIPVPEVVATGSWCGRAVALTTWCAGAPVADRLTTLPRDEQRATVHRFGRAHAELHAQALNPTDVATLTTVGRTVPTFDRTSEISLLHLDFHPLNVLDNGTTITGIVDWANAAAGDRRFDLARTRGLFAMFPVFAPDIDHITEIAQQLTVWWAEGYAQTLPVPDDHDLAQYLAWAGRTMRADWAPRVAAGAAGNDVLTAIDTWTETWTT